MQHVFHTTTTYVIQVLKNEGHIAAICTGVKNTTRTYTYQHALSWHIGSIGPCRCDMFLLHLVFVQVRCVFKPEPVAATCPNNMSLSPCVHRGVWP